MSRARRDKALSETTLFLCQTVMFKGMGAMNGADLALIVLFADTNRHARGIHGGGLTGHAESCKSKSRNRENERHHGLYSLHPYQACEPGPRPMSL